MRRFFQTLSLTVMSLVLMALPAVAADETAAKTEAFGQGQWDGMVLALIFGAIIGIALFIDAYSGAKDEGPSHH